MRKMKKGFTLVEILIVVVILGILAAIVIPQFSQASTEARLNSLASNLQTMRSQISLFKIQHNDTAPLIATFAGQMTGKTLQSGAVDAAGTFGPYLQAVPNNPFNSSATVAAADGAGVGWVYDEATGEIHAGVNGLDAATVASIRLVDPL